MTLPSPSRLQQIQSELVFEPTPMRVALAAYHVPFDELTGRRSTEQALLEGIHAGARLSVSGVSGVGKSSVIYHVVGPVERQLAVFRVPVDAEDDEVVQEPAAFCRHVIRTVSRQLHEAALVTGAERRLLLEGSGAALSLQRGRSAGAGGRIALWMLQADLRAEAESVIETGVHLSGEEAVALAARLLDLVRAAGRAPVLVVDDSDAWMARPGGRDRSGLVAPFFGRVLRTVADELPASLVVAVHDHYRQQADYPAATNYLLDDIAVPRLPGRAALGRVLGARLAFHDGTTLSDVVADDALDVLWDEYGRGDGNLRRSMLSAHTALQVAVDTGADVVTAHHVEAALARYA